MKASLCTLMTQNAQILSLDHDEITLKSVMEAVQQNPNILKAAYQYCRIVTKNHYENFPVASLILPKNLRPAVEAIYAFSRTADDFADEHEYQGVRFEKLNEWESNLNDSSRPTHPIFIALHDAMIQHDLSKKLFTDLLAAFKMDVTKKRYNDFHEVIHYCQHSANPVGRLVLHLFKQDPIEYLKMSDCICTALQLTNFWQDISIDLKKDRIYLPLEELEKFNTSTNDLFNHQLTDNFKRLMNFQIERTKQIFLKGKPLGLALPGKLGIEIRLTWLTGMTILKKIMAVNYDIFNKRPTLTKFDFVKMFFIAINKKRYAKFTI